VADDCCKRSEIECAPDGDHRFSHGWCAECCGAARCISRGSSNNSERISVTVECAPDNNRGCSLGRLAECGIPACCTGLGHDGSNAENIAGTIIERAPDNNRWFSRAWCTASCSAACRIVHDSSSDGQTFGIIDGGNRACLVNGHANSTSTCDDEYQTVVADSIPAGSCDSEQHSIAEIRRGICDCFIIRSVVNSSCIRPTENVSASIVVDVLPGSKHDPEVECAAVNSVCALIRARPCSCGFESDTTSHDWLDNTKVHTRCIPRCFCTTSVNASSDNGFDFITRDDEREGHHTRRYACRIAGGSCYIHDFQIDVNGSSDDNACRTAGGFCCIHDFQIDANGSSDDSACRIAGGFCCIHDFQVDANGANDDNVCGDDTYNRSIRSRTAQSSSSD
jgi:hypothetical protein